MAAVDVAMPMPGGDLHAVTDVATREPTAYTARRNRKVYETVRYTYCGLRLLRYRTVIALPSSVTCLRCQTEVAQHRLRISDYDG